MRTYTLNSLPAGKCEHTRTVFVPTPELTHHGKTICANCGKFVAWIAKPETLERQRRNGEAIVRLRSESKLTEWEKGFISTLDGQGPRISPKQQEWLDKLIAKYGIDIQSSNNHVD